MFDFSPLAPITIKLLSDHTFLLFCLFYSLKK